MNESNVRLQFYNIFLILKLPGCLITYDVKSRKLFLIENTKKNHQTVIDQWGGKNSLACSSIVQTNTEAWNKLFLYGFGKKCFAKDILIFKLKLFCFFKLSEKVNSNKKNLKKFTFILFLARQYIF